MCDSNSMNDAKKIDMSPKVIDRRLRELSQLYEFGMSMRHVRRLEKLSEFDPSHAESEDTNRQKPRDE